MAIHVLADLEPAHECARLWYFLFCSSVFGPLANTYPIERHGFPDGDICAKEGRIMIVRFKKMCKTFGGLRVPQAFPFSCLSIAGGPVRPHIVWYAPAWEDAPPCLRGCFLCLRGCFLLTAPIAWNLPGKHLWSFPGRQRISMAQNGSRSLGGSIWPFRPYFKT